MGHDTRVQMFLSLFAGPVLALNCDDVTGLINAGVSADLVAQTIRAASPAPSSADIDCLLARHTPKPVLDAVTTLREFSIQCPPCPPKRLRRWCVAPTTSG